MQCWLDSEQQTSEQCWNPAPHFSLTNYLPLSTYTHTCTLHTHTHHVTPLFWDLHWLQSREHITFQLAILVYRSHPSLSLWSFPTCHQLQPPTSSFIIIIIVTDPMNTTHNSRRPCLSGGRKPSLEQSVARHHNSSDFRHFPESTENVPVLLFILAMTDACTPFSGLSVLLGHYK